MNQTGSTGRILRLTDVKTRTGLSRSTIYSHVANRLFPQPFKLGLRAVGWLEVEIDSWIADRLNRRPLTYQSQQENEAYRLLGQARKLHMQLGGDGSLVDPTEPPKPKGMHWKTYHRKLDKMLELNEYSDMLVYRKWGALI